MWYFEEQKDVCKNITSSIAAAATTTSSMLDPNDQVFRILTRGNGGNHNNNPHHHRQQHQQQRLSMKKGFEGSNTVIPILAYRCHSNLKPIPVVSLSVCFFF